MVFYYYIFHSHLHMQILNINLDFVFTSTRTTEHSHTQKIFKQHVPLYQLCKYLFPLNSYKISLRRSALSFRNCRLFMFSFQFSHQERPTMTSHVTKVAELLASFVFSSISSSPSTVTCLSGSVGVGRQRLLVACGSFCARFFWIFEEVLALKHSICIFQSVVFAQCRYLHNNAKLLQYDRITGFAGGTADTAMVKYRWVVIFAWVFVRCLEFSCFWRWTADNIF